MDADAVFTRYDIRGDHPDEIDAAFAERLGRAAGRYAQDDGRGQVVVGRDARAASEAVYAAFIDGIRAADTNVVDVGTGTTDRVAVGAGHYGGIGVMVTASHHAWERTGFKFLYEEGYGFSNDDLDTVRALFRDDPAGGGDGSVLRAQHEHDERYMDAVEAFAADRTDGIQGTVLLDAVGGAERTAAAVFEACGADVIEMERDGLPAPEPSAETRQDVAEALAAAEADVAVGCDPDGDRVFLVHPELGWVDGDRLFYLLARITAPERIVASVDTAPFIEETGAAVSYTRVGDIFVAAEGVEQDADLLGEPNGHYAFPSFSWYNSGIVAGLLLAAHHDRLPAMLEPVQDYRSHRFVAAYGSMAERDDAMQDVKKQVATAGTVVDRVDGVKFEMDGWTGLVRPSGTAPKIRLALHGRDPGEAAEAVRDRLLGP